MTVQAKFRVLKIDQHWTPDPSAVCATIHLSPVYANDGPNASWSKATPQGKLEMMITNPTAIEQFELGKSYVMTFEPSDD